MKSGGKKESNYISKNKRKKRCNFFLPMKRKKRKHWQKGPIFLRREKCVLHIVLRGEEEKMSLSLMLAKGGGVGQKKVSHKKPSSALEEGKRGKICHS